MYIRVKKYVVQKKKKRTEIRVLNSQVYSYKICIQHGI